MNIFILSKDPVEAARMQCDKHVVKMVLESAQMLSTAHRVLDGSLSRQPSKSGKMKVKHWALDNPEADQLLYKAVHVNHPCTVWTGESASNYDWHYMHFKALAVEYRHRYDKQHKSFVDLWDLLQDRPMNIPNGGLTPFKLAMGAAPECNDPSDPVGSYRAFYQTKQDRFDMQWTKRDTPDWFNRK